MLVFAQNENRELGRRAPSWASPPSWKGKKIAGESAAGWSGRCLVPQRGSQGTAWVWFKVVLKKPEKTLNVPEVHGPTF